MYYVEDGKVFGLPRSSSAAEPSAAGCTTGGARLALNNVACSEAVGLYLSYLAGNVGGPWRCAGGAESGRCYVSDGLNEASPTYSFSWRP
jgi:hypothetical protein